MAVISSIIAGLTAIGSAVASAASAVGGFLGTTLFTIGGGVVTSGAAAGTVAGGLSVTVGGALAAVGLGTGAAITLGGMYKSARASAAMQKQQAEAIKKLQENQGEPDVARVNNGLQDNSRKARTLSSLRIGLLPQEQNKEEITRNVYGVDTNQVATSTQNMVGLNIAAA